MADPYIGEIRLVGFNFAPLGWADCNGQLLSIAENDALFNLIGTTYGGDGQTTFALPDFRGRMAIGQGTSTTGTSYLLSETGGTESVFLTTQQLPQHTHLMGASSGPGTSTNAQSGVHSVIPNATKADRIYGTEPGGSASPNMISVEGGSQPHTNLQPYLGMRYIIALNGIFPSPT